MQREATPTVASCGQREARRVRQCKGSKASAEHSRKEGLQSASWHPPVAGVTSERLNDAQAQGFTVNGDSDSVRCLWRILVGKCDE